MYCVISVKHEQEMTHLPICRKHTLRIPMSSLHTFQGSRNTTFLGNTKRLDKAEYRHSHVYKTYPSLFDNFPIFAIDFIIIAASDSLLLKRSGCLASIEEVTRSDEALTTLLSSSSNRCETPKSLILMYPLESSLPIKSSLTNWISVLVIIMNH